MYLSLQYRIKFQTLMGVFSCERLNSSIFYFMKTRVCVRCKLEKPLSEFYRSKDYKYHYDCKECSKKQMAELHRKKIKIIPIIDLFEENDGETISEPEFSESMEDDKIIKAKEGIGKLLREGLNHRKLADEYLLQIEKDYVNLNHRTKQDFGIDYTEAVTKRDIYSWRLWIRELNDKKVIQKDA